METLRQGRTDKLLALEELLEEEIEEFGGRDTVGLVFVERRVTAMALHNYFQWRAIKGGKLTRAKKARLRSDDLFPQVEYTKEGEGDIFEDSSDDPFLAFQTPPQKPANEPELNQEKHVACSDQFMDAEEEHISEGEVWSHITLSWIEVPLTSTALSHYRY